MTNDPKRPHGTSWGLGHSADEEPRWKSTVWVLIPILVTAAIVALAV